MEIFKIVYDVLGGLAILVVLVEHVAGHFTWKQAIADIKADVAALKKQKTPTPPTPLKAA